MEDRSRRGAVEREHLLLQTLIDRAHTCLVLLDNDFHFLAVNASYAAACGRRPEELLGKNHFDFYPHPENEALFRKVRDTGKPIEFKAKPFIFPDHPEWGITYWDWRLSAVHEADGQALGLLLSLVDVTEQTRTALELAESRAHFQAIFQNAAVGIVVADLRGGILDANQAFQQMLGYTLPELQNLNFRDITHPDDLAADIQLFDDLLRRQSGHFQTEKRYIGADGRSIWTRLTASLILGQNAEPAFVIGLVQDIEHKKELERELQGYYDDLENLIKIKTERLQQSLADTTALLDSTGDESLLVDSNLRILNASISICKKMDLPRELLIGRTYSSGIEPDVANFLKPLLEEAFKSGQSFQMTEQLSGRWLRIHICPIANDSEKACRIAVIIRDITSQKEMDLQLARHRVSLADQVSKLSAEVHEIIMALPAALVVLEFNGREEVMVVESNRLASQTLGLGLALPQPLHGANPATSALKQQLSLMAKFALRSRTGQQSEFAVHTDGERRIFNLQAFRMTSTRVGVLFDDITQSVARERQREFLELCEIEIKKFGRDLHDLIGGQLSGLLLLLGSIQSHPEWRSGPADATLAVCTQMIKQAIGQVRDFSRRMLAQPADLNGFISAVQLSMEEVQEHFRINCSLKVDQTIRIQQADAWTHLLHIVREAITNSIRHGQSRTVEIQLIRSGKHAMLQIRNDGLPLPLPTSDSTGIGLKIMRMRVEALEGLMQVSNREGEGVEYLFYLPCQP
ncbi:MAG: PAS domain S-box protein [Spirochaetales bacterium]|nr:PAS domain S-box protein [Spirochaetales bacterium]